MKSQKYLAASLLLFLFFLLFPFLILNSKTPVNNRHTVAINKNKAIEAMAKMNAVIAEADSLYIIMNLDAVGLSKKVFELAIRGYRKLENLNKVTREGILSIVDFSKPSNQRRFFILDLYNGQLLMNTLVAHGRNSGMTYANSFSNKPESNKSSLGFYITLNTYYGENGLALRLMGEEPGVNDKAYKRNIVIHGCDYANENFIRTTGHLGRSYGCPAVPMKEHEKIIDYIKDGTCLFIYHPTKNYLKKSRLVNS